MSPFPPTSRRALQQLLLTLWQISNTGVRVFIWGGLRDGAAGLRATGRALQALTIFGLLLIGLFLFGLLFSDALRFSAPLTLLANDSTATRGLLAPLSTIPITLAAMTLGWGYLLAGALHTRPLLRWVTFGIYVGFGVLPLGSQFSPLIAEGATIVLPIVLIALLIAFIVLPRVNLPIALEWCLVLGLHGTLVAVALFSTARYELITDDLWVGNMVSSLAQSHYLFTLPFLVIAGLGWADFGIEASRWTAQAVSRHAVSWVISLLLLALLGVRVVMLIVSLVSDGIAAGQWAAWGGGLLLCAGILAILLWRMRQPAGTLPEGLLPTLGGLLPAGQLLLVMALQIASVALLFQAFSPSLGDQATRLSNLIVELSETERRYRSLAFVVVGLIVAALGRRRSNATLIAFGLVLAWSQLVTWLIRDGNPLAALSFEYSDLDTLLLVGLTALTIFWFARRQLTADRALRLLALTILFALLNQTDFLDNPLSPLFAFAGVFFIVFGIIWNILTVAAGFLQHDSAGFPRDSRLLMYLGYVLISVSVVYWYLASHNLQMQINQSTMNQLGFLAIGLPVVYLMLIERGQSLVMAEEP